MNGIDKFVREAMPIQEEERASGKPAAKARLILKPSSTSGWDSTPMKQRQCIDIEIHASKDPRCFQVRRTEKKVPTLREPELFSEIPVPSSNPRAFRKYNQSCISIQCTVTRRFHRVFLSRRKRKRIEVNSESWFDSWRSQSQHRQTCCVLHCCEFDG